MVIVSNRCFEDLLPTVPPYLLSVWMLRIALHEDTFILMLVGHKLCSSDCGLAVSLNTMCLLQCIATPCAAYVFVSHVRLRQLHAFLCQSETVPEGQNS